MKLCLAIICLAFSWSTLAQNEQVVLMDFVKIEKNKKEEAMYYYNENWKLLREKALEKGYIDSYQLLETEPSEKAPFNLILITRFKNQYHFDLREQYFKELMQEVGPLKLMNEIQPAAFRKTLFGKIAKSVWSN